MAETELDMKNGAERPSPFVFTLAGGAGATLLFLMGTGIMVYAWQAGEGLVCFVGYLVGAAIYVSGSVVLAWTGETHSDTSAPSILGIPSNVGIVVGTVILLIFTIPFLLLGSGQEKESLGKLLLGLNAVQLTAFILSSACQSLKHKQWRKAFDQFEINKHAAAEAAIEQVKQQAAVDKLNAELREVEAARQREQKKLDADNQAADAIRRKDARARCELFYHQHEPDMENRFNRERFNKFLTEYMNDKEPAEEVEKRGEELKTMIQAHLDHIRPPPKPDETEAHLKQLREEHESRFRDNEERRQREHEETLQRIAAEALEQAKAELAQTIEATAATAAQIRLRAVKIVADDLDQIELSLQKINESDHAEHLKVEETAKIRRRQKELQETLVALQNQLEQ